MEYFKKYMEMMSKSISITLGKITYIYIYKSGGGRLLTNGAI